MAYELEKFESVRIRPRQVRGKERIKLILSSALDEFRIHGLDAVTTNDIAKKAGIPIGSLYRYFPNRDAIITALTQLYSDDLSEIFEHVGKNPMLPALSWDEVMTLIIDSWMHYS